jgi:hypothetical protein
MSTESHIYYGFSLTEDYDKIQEVLGEILDDEGFDLQDYVWENNAGHSHYDGGGYGQVTCVGKDIPVTDRGYVVTDEIIAEVKSMIANLPSEFQKALKEVYGEVPEPKFEHEHSDG